jgi:tellurite methyltransferase
MSEQDRNKWDRRYAEDSQRKRIHPGELISQWVDKLPVGRALDVACGLGQKSIYLAQAGFQVDAIDVSAIGLDQAKQAAEAEGLAINWIQHDLDLPYEFGSNYDVIIVMWYVDLSLIRRLCDQLAPGGYLLCEEHLACDLASSELIGSTLIGPGNPDFRVAPNALREAVSDFDVCYYDEYVGVSDDHQDSKGSLISRAQLVVRGKD